MNKKKCEWKKIGVNVKKRCGRVKKTKQMKKMWI